MNHGMDGHAVLLYDLRVVGWVVGFWCLLWSVWLLASVRIWKLYLMWGQPYGKFCYPQWLGDHQIHVNRDYLQFNMGSEPQRERKVCMRVVFFNPSHFQSLIFGTAEGFSMSVKFRTVSIRAPCHIKTPSDPLTVTGCSIHYFIQELGSLTKF
jgi:hypothetical protein